MEKRSDTHNDSLKFNLESAAFVGKLNKEFEKNGKIAAKDSPWLNELFKRPYLGALILRNKKTSQKYLAVLISMESMLISDYKEEKEAELKIKRLMLFQNNICVNSLKVVANGNILEAGHTPDGKARTVIIPEEQLSFMNEIKMSSIDENSTKLLEKRPPALHLQKANLN